jgi:L-lactate dehydrogenase complex protein LldG
MNAREEILARVRAAVGPAAATGPAEVARDYLLSSTVDDLTTQLTQRLADYGATVVATPAHFLVDRVREQVRGRVRVAPGLAGVLGDVGEPDDGGDPAALDRVDTAVTGCAAACAQTGTIALDGSADQGRRALTLVPDRHVCIVHTGQIVGTVPELLARLDPRAPTTLVSGPSATSDIELKRVAGVHGPRQLVVILVTDDT